jgi:hypothetical protein
VAALPTIWELVNGTGIEVDGVRIVLIPSAAIDTDELRVPQEWVDIPSWVADYYLAVQVNPDEGWIQISGYTTHQRLKTQGNYDAGDRAYSLPEENLIQDLNILWLARELCPQEILKADVLPLPTLPLSQAHSLLSRLGDPAVTLPRQAVPFPLWAALLEHGGWRQRLYEQRQGLEEQWSIPQWLQANVSELAQKFGWGQAQLQLATARAMRSGPTPGMSRSLEIAGQTYELRIFPLPKQGSTRDRSTSALTNETTTLWRFELSATETNAMIPAGFKLRLLTEDLQPFDHNEDGTTEDTPTLYVDVILEPGEGLVWEIEPMPENCDLEILRF